MGWAPEGVTGAKWAKADRDLRSTERLHLENLKRALNSLKSTSISNSYTSAPATPASCGQYSRAPTSSQLCPTSSLLTDVQFYPQSLGFCQKLQALVLQQSSEARLLPGPTLNQPESFVLLANDQLSIEHGMTLCYNRRDVKRNLCKGRVSLFCKGKALPPSSLLLDIEDEEVI